MSVNRPTFHEAWHRVEALRPRLRATVQTRRQHFRGQRWHVIADPANNSFYRLDDAAYHFVASFDGQRTVGEVWRACQQQWGDRAPTQGEAIRLLGQLYTSNLIHAEGAGDAAGMFERHRKRFHQQIRGQLLSLLSVRLPLLDPDAWLERWSFLFGWIFRWPGLLVWTLMLLAGGTHLVGRWGELRNAAGGVLEPQNLFLLYVAFAGIKLIHEFGHAFACKTFGKEEGDGGEVHAMGIMLLVLMPIPYVDASSAWTLRNKWRRAFVAAAGMYVELAVAAIAAVIWARTGSGTLTHALAYNVMFVASATTLLFNANPLLRYDGYYILSDLVEMPNLAQRSKEYVYYLVKKHVYGVRRPRNPAHGPREKRWLFTYALASTSYRVIISISILFYVANKLFIIGVILALMALFAWVVRPLGQWVRYLFTSPELARTRPRALAATAGFILTLSVGLGLVRLPDRDRAEGVVQARKMTRIHMASDGFVQSVAPAGDVKPDTNGPLVRAVNPELEARRRQIEARIAFSQTQRRAAITEEPALAQSLAEQIDALQQQLDRVNAQIERLTIDAPFPGAWIVTDPSRFQGAFLSRGQRIGVVATLDQPVIRVAADQQLGPRIRPEIGVGASVEVRLKGRPGVAFPGEITRVLPAGRRRLPSPALGYLAGGGIRVEPKDERGTLAAEPFFEVHVKPDATLSSDTMRLFAGQRVVVRFDLPRRSLISQSWIALRQMFQRRFEI